MTHVDVSQALYAVEAAIAGRAASQDIPAPRTLDRHEWPPDYGTVLAWRQQQLARFEQDPEYLASALAYYGQMDPQSCIDWINHWCDTIDTRNIGRGKPVRMPFVMFRRQEELLRFTFACMLGEAAGLVDKSRDMGATWCFVGFSNWGFTFQAGMAIGWGSNMLEQVDKLGEPDTIFEKLRRQIQATPEIFRRTNPLRPATPLLEGIHLKHGICINPDNGAVVSGQGGKHIGRGGRRRIYLVDEAAHLEHPEAVEASLSENTRCRIDLSSAGMPGSVFDRTREAGRVWEVGAPVTRDRANVFVMDWTDHPEKTPEWYGQRTAYYASKGMQAVVAREIDRNPMGAQEGIIIPYEHVEAAVDAHVHLGLDDSGGWWGGLDLADEGPDKNALVRGRGIVVRHAEEIAERDPGAVARRAFRACRETSPITLQYDSGGGFGGSVKSEFNRLGQDEGIDVSWLTLVPWSAAAAVLDPGEPIIRGDASAPTSKNFFENLKAQAWWSVARMFYRTWQMRSGEADHPPDQLISLDSSTIPAPVLAKMMRELSQATMGQSSRLKFLVDKAPDGAKSPNLADALVMGRFPARSPARHRASLVGPRVFV